MIKLFAFVGVLLLTQASSAATTKSVPVTDVWVVFKTHFDIGYNGTVAQILAKYRGPMVDNAMAVIARNRTAPAGQHFSWTVPGWPLTRILDEKQTPDRKAKVIAALKEGSIAVHALPFGMHTESLDLEDLVRGLHFSSQIARDLGQPLPIAAKMTDVPSHSWVLPTLLHHAGIRFLHLGVNAGSQYPRVPQLFWWQGADGSRILCSYTTDYGSPPVPKPGWPAKNYLAMIMEGDNHGPPTIEEVENIRRTIAVRLPKARVTFGTLDDFCRAIEAEKPDLEVVRGDMPDTWIHGIMSNPTETGTARNIRPLEPALETLDTQLRGWGVKTESPAAALAEAYENSLLYGEHTWGFSGGYVGFHYGDDWKKLLANGHYDQWLKSFEDKKDYIRKTQKIVSKELRTRLKLLAKGVNVEGKRIVVYNPLPWPRTEIVELTDAIDGLTYTDLFLADEVPANGYKTFRITAKGNFDATGMRSEQRTFETKYFRLTFDFGRGGIESLIDKSTGRELVDKTSPYILGQYLHERFSRNEVDSFLKAYTRPAGSWVSNDFGKPGMPGPEQSPYAAKTPSDWQLRVKNDPLFDRAVLWAADRKGLAQNCEIEFTFPRHEPAISVKWFIYEKTPSPIPEGGWLCFPFAVADPQFTLGRMGAPVDPAKDIVRGTNRYLGAVSTGVSIRGNDGTGMALCPIDSPLVSLDRPGLWKWSMDFVPKRPTVFVNLYNNMWNTNFQFWQEGTWSERVRIWPLPKEADTAQNMAVKSWNTRVPLLAVAADGPAGKLPQSQAGLSLSRLGVLVTAFGDNPDGQGTLFRVWDQSGVTGQLAVTLPGKFKTATPVDLRGESAGKPIQITDNMLTFDLHAYAPASFVLAK